MKKYLCIALLLCFAVIFFAGCGSGALQKSDSSVDVDLTVMSTTLVYSKLTQMMKNPEDYLGQTVKMDGVYNNEFYLDRYYHYVIILDATACCRQGMMFIWNGNHFPDEYPVTERK